MKKICILFLTLCALMCGICTVDAKVNADVIPVGTEIKLFDDDDDTETPLTDSDEGEKGSKKCDSLFGDPDDPDKKSLAFYLQWALDIMKYLGIILCVVLTVVDFFKALLGQEKDAYKPLAKKAIQRLIYAVCLFFTPIFVKVLLELIGVYGTCGIS